MALILLTAFISVTALALPNPTNSLLPRDFPQPLGFDQGSPFDQLEIMVYSQENCGRKPAGIFDGNYGFYIGYQMKSYHLSRSLYDYENLDFYAGLGTDSKINNTVDDARNTHYTESCLQFDVRAGSNATISEVASEKEIALQPAYDGKTAGCHTLDKNEWCAIIWKTIAS